jgi:hypothetical protein
MLKLTLYEDKNRIVYISAKSIQAIYRGAGDYGTYVEMCGMSHIVCERPEQILAMDEMVYELYPPMCVDSAGKISRVK